MTRRSFLARMSAAFAALSLGRCTTEPPLVLADIAPQTIHFTELDRFLAEEAERLGRLIVKRMAAPSPWFALLEPGTFPSNCGETQRVSQR